MDGPMQAAFERAAWPKPSKAKRECKRGYRKERYSAEFKQRAVDLVKELGSVKKAADQLDLHAPTVYSWVYIVEHGGVLEPSKGWVPENGDRYLNPRPGHGSDSPGSKRPDMGPRTNPIYEQRGQTMHEVKYEGETTLNVGSGTVNGPQQDVDPYAFSQKEAQKQREQTKPLATEETFQLAKELVDNRRLKAENEALRQIIRGYQNLINLT